MSTHCQPAKPSNPIHPINPVVGGISLKSRVAFRYLQKNVFRGLKTAGFVWTMKSSPSRKYENFSCDHQSKEADKHSLDSQDTASLVSSFKLLEKLLILFVY